MSTDPNLSEISRYEHALSWWFVFFPSASLTHLLRHLSVFFQDRCKPRERVASVASLGGSGGRPWAMARYGQRKCLCCHDLFFPEPRSAGRQRYCSAAACRRASKAARLAKPENQGYFVGPMNVRRVQAWRAVHPGYARGRSRVRRALQDSLPPQVADLVEQIDDRAVPAKSPGALALQDLSTPSQHC